MIKGKTADGFNFEIDQEALADNWDIVELASEIEEKQQLIPKLIEETLGKEQYKKLKEFCRMGGKVSSKKLLKEYREIENILAENAETKNS